MIVRLQASSFSKPVKPKPFAAAQARSNIASKLRMEINSKPEALDVLDRKIMQLEIEIEAIKREDDKSKLKLLNADLADFKEERNEITLTTSFKAIFGSKFSRVFPRAFIISKQPDRTNKIVASSHGIKSLPSVFGRLRAGSWDVK